jgi:hypothetical protein
MKEVSPELAQHIMHLAHLKFPDLVGGNSAIPFDLEDKTQLTITPADILSELDV